MMYAGALLFGAFFSTQTIHTGHWGGGVHAVDQSRREPA